MRKGIKVTPESLDPSNPHRSCLYVRQYLRVHNLKPGDEWFACEYMAWIGSKHSEFREPRGIADFRGYNATEQEEFNAWLSGQPAVANCSGKGGEERQ